MSIHYQIDPFTLNGDIIDVTTAESGSTESTGSTIIRIPDGVAVHNNPTNLTDLLTEKYDGLLAFYAGFQHIFADPCLDGSTVDPTTTSKKLLIANGFVNHCLLSGGTYLSVVHVAALAPAPTQAVMVWEDYVFADSDIKANRFQRTYDETTHLTCQLSFNGPAGTFNSTTDGAVLNIPVPDQGANLQVRFDNPTGSRVYLGSWALIY